MLSGHSATAGFASPDAGGQFENFPRFLENWSGKTVTLAGSMISLWTSRMTKGAWGCCNYYSPPNRDWNFDTRFQDPENLPPATPVVGHVLRVGFLRRY